MTVFVAEPLSGLEIRLLGREFGNCLLQPVHPKFRSDDTKDWCRQTIARLNSFATRQLQTDKLLILRPSFVPERIVDFDSCSPLRVNGGKLYRATEQGDVYRLEPGESVLIALADCLSAVVWGQGKCFVIHLGFRGLIPEFEDGQPLLSHVIKTQFPKLTKPKHRSGLSVWLGAGADDCCFGYPEDHPLTQEVRERLLWYQFREVSNGPYIGNLGISQMRIAVKQVCRLGIENIYLDSRCTSCWGNPDHREMGACFSNLRSFGQSWERNGLVVTRHF